MNNFKIEEVTLKIILDKFEKLHNSLYDETIDTVSASFELAKIVEELENNAIYEVKND